MSFPQYLISIGFEVNRKVFNKITREWNYVPCEFENDYSTMVSGNLDYRFLKDDIEIIWGLNEQGLPPSLVYPRPSGIERDFEMHRFLEGKSNEKIIELIIS